MTSYPGIHKACLEIALDNGGIHRERSEAMQAKEYECWIARQPSDLLPAIDAWLSSLSNDDLETVCCGGDDEQARLLTTAPPFTNDLLDNYFDEVC